jgi:hypothetical protein
VTARGVLYVCNTISCSVLDLIVSSIMYHDVYLFVVDFWFEVANGWVTLKKLMLRMSLTISLNHLVKMPEAFRTPKLLV